MDLLHHLSIAGMLVPVLLFAGGCMSSSEESAENERGSEDDRTPADTDLPEVRSREDVERVAGERAAVIGTYRQQDVRKRRPGDEPVYQGHAALELRDGTTVYLEPMWSDEALRSDEEIDTFEDERARAIGTLKADCPPPEPERPVARITGPCLHPVEKIEAVE